MAMCGELCSIVIEKNEIKRIKERRAKLIFLFKCREHSKLQGLKWTKTKSKRIKIDKSKKYRDQKIGFILNI